MCVVVAMVRIDCKCMNAGLFLWSGVEEEGGDAKKRMILDSSCHPL